MDFDSSSKFISSLAKFLQSLCNGYVDFDNGVEVIGHIYLSVDTGKKIDYILNEKVCKTDENSVTFISNSFHAQPAEKPKPAPKPSKPEQDKSSDPGGSQEDEEIVFLDEPDPSPPSNQSSAKPPQSPSASKRSYQQSFSQKSRSHPAKHPRLNPNGAHERGSPHSDPHNSNPGFLPSQTHQPLDSSSIAATSEADMSHLSRVQPQTPSKSQDPSNNPSSLQNIKEEPATVINEYDVNVKQEFDQTLAEGDQESYDTYYGDDYYGGAQGDQGHIDYSQMAGQHGDMYQGQGPSGEMTGGENSGFHHPDALSDLSEGCPVAGCHARYAYNGHRLRLHWKEKHEQTVLKFLCPSCSYSSKRKRDVGKHMMVVHGGTGDTLELQAQMMANEYYIDPAPFKLEQVLEMTGHAGRTSFC